MAPRKSKPAAANVLASAHSSKITKTKSKNTRRTTSSLNSTTPSVKPYRVKRYRNGILNLEKTPSHLVNTVKRNANESPLLRLPPEVRNRIWCLAMGGQLVALPNRERAKGFAIQGKRDLDRRPAESIVMSWKLQALSNAIKLPSAFHLPEVSRQIYAETVLTAYQQNAFIFEYENLAQRNPMTRLMVAQRRAITRVVPDSLLLCSHMSTTASNARKLMTHHLPNILSIVITEDAFEYLEYICSHKPASAGLSTTAQLHAWIVQNLRNVYGDKIEISFESHSTE